MHIFGLISRRGTAYVGKHKLTCKYMIGLTLFTFLNPQALEEDFVSGLQGLSDVSSLLAEFK